MNTLSKILLVACAVLVCVVGYYQSIAWDRARKIDKYERALIIGKTEADLTVTRTTQLLEEAKQERALRVDLQARYDTLQAARKTIRDERHPPPRTVPALRDSILRASGQ